MARTNPDENYRFLAPGKSNKQSRQGAWARAKKLFSKRKEPSENAHFGGKDDGIESELESPTKSNHEDERGSVVVRKMITPEGLCLH